MTLEELRTAVKNTQQKTQVLSNASRDLRQFINRIEDIVNNEFSETIDVDEFILIQAPIYAVIKSSVQAAAADLP